MTFNQRMLDRSVNQTRDIFDKYIYKTEDLSSEVMAPGYFAASRFSFGDEAIIEIESSDAYLVGKVDGTGTLAPTYLNSKSSGSSPANLVVINSESDFPTQDATTITLEDKVTYLVGQPFSTAKSFVVNGEAKMEGVNRFAAMVTYTGTGFMFSGTGSLSIDKMEFFCDDGTLFGALTITNLFSFVDSRVIGAKSAGTILGINMIIIMERCGITDIAEDGLSFSGSAIVATYSDATILTNNPVGFALDITGLVTFRFSYDRASLGGVPGAIGLNSLGNANLAPGIIGTVDSAVLDFGGATPLGGGISVSDNQWQFINNSGVADSRNAADAFLTVDEVVTVSASGTFYEIGGVSWSNTYDDRFSVSSDGVITYTGITPIEVKVSAAATVSTAGFFGDEVEVRVAKNWIANDPGIVRSGSVTQNGTPTSVPLEVLVDVDTGDDLRLITANNDDTTNITVNRASIAVIEA